MPITKTNLIKDLGIGRDLFEKICKEARISGEVGISSITTDSKGRRHRAMGIIYQDWQVEALKSEVQKYFDNENISFPISTSQYSNGERQQVAAKERFAKSQTLKEMGVSEKEIARVLGVSRDIVGKYLACKTYDEYRERFIPKPQPKPTPMVGVEKPAIEPEIQVVSEKKIEPMADMVMLQLLKQIEAKISKLVLIEERRDARQFEKEKEKRNRKHKIPFLGN